MKKIIFATLIFASAPTFGMMKFSKFNRLARSMSHHRDNKEFIEHLSRQKGARAFEAPGSKTVFEDQEYIHQLSSSNPIVDYNEFVAQSRLHTKLKNAYYATQILQYLEDNHQTGSSLRVVNKCYHVIRALGESDEK